MILSEKDGRIYVDGVEVEFLPLVGGEIITLPADITLAPTMKNINTGTIHANNSFHIGDIGQAIFK